MALRSSSILITRFAVALKKSPVQRMPRSGIDLIPASVSSLATFSGVRGKSGDTREGSIGATIVKPFSSSAAAAEEDIEEVVSSVQGYYDDPNALNFHMQAWGGDIHLGRYDLLSKEEQNMEVRDRIKRATALSTGILLGKAFPAGGPSPAGGTVADMGSAFGSTARRTAKELGCKVECIEISRGLNGANAKLTAAAGLSDKLSIPGERSFFDTKLPSGSVDTVLSQDSFSHASTEHHRAIAEAARVLKPGGTFAFTDIMQTDGADTSKLEEVYRQIGIARLASPKSFKKMGESCGLELVEMHEFGKNLGTHYQHLVEVSMSLRSVIEGVDDAWFDRMEARYGSWVSAAKYDVLTWGLLVFKKKAE